MLLESQLLLLVVPCFCSYKFDFLYNDYSSFFSSGDGILSETKEPTTLMTHNELKPPSFPILSLSHRFQHILEDEDSLSKFSDLTKEKIHHIPTTVKNSFFQIPYFYLLKYVNLKHKILYPSTSDSFESIKEEDGDDDGEVKDNDEEEEEKEEEIMDEDDVVIYGINEKDRTNFPPPYESPRKITFPLRKSFHNCSSFLSYIFQEYKHLCLRTGRNLVFLMLHENRSDKTYIPNSIKKATTIPGGPLSSPLNNGPVSIMKDSPDWNATVDGRSLRIPRGKYSWDERLHFSWSSPPSSSNWGIRLHYPIVMGKDEDGKDDDNIYLDAWYRYVAAMAPWKMEIVRQILPNGKEKGYYENFTHDTINLVRLYDDPFTNLVTEPEFNNIFIDFNDRRGAFKSCIRNLRLNDKEDEEKNN